MAAVSLLGGSSEPIGNWQMNIPSANGVEVLFIGGNHIKKRSNLALGGRCLANHSKGMLYIILPTGPRGYNALR